MKKILILGGNAIEVEIVKKAKKLGYYTIVTDNHTDWNLSPAKLCADEGWNISWSDIDCLEVKCKEAGVYGVLAGFSEFRVENMIRLCSRLHFPCGLTLEQLNITRDKLLFKKTCRKYSINTVPEYSLDSNDIKFPVIIKPVDRAGSIGINVANNQAELNAYYELALSLSPSKQVIIEDYIADGTKVDVYYYVKDGKITFLGSSDTIMCKGEIGAKILQKAWPFKSKYEKQYLEEIDSKVRKMFQGLKINNTYATMSAFYYNGNFYFFEAGFRLSGELSYHYYESMSGINYVESMIKYAMGDEDVNDFIECHNSNMKCIVLNFFGLNGVVSKIVGLDHLAKNRNIYDVRLYIKEQDEIQNSTSVFHKIAMFTIVADSIENLRSTVKEVNSAFDILGKDGKSLVYEQVSSEELIQYYGLNG